MYYEDTINEYAEQISMKYETGRMSYARCEKLLDKLEEWENHAVVITQEAIEVYGEEWQ